MSFLELHKPGQPFVLANAFDIGSAKVMTALGAEAIGTTSSGHAFTIGKADMGQVTRDEAMAHAEEVVRATHLPVSADFENGYGDAPEDVAETVRLAAEIGLAGCSIEDMQYPDGTVYSLDHAVERVRAGVSAARALGREFVFVARADGIMNDLYDVDEAIKRLRAFEEVGADCLYAPLPKTRADLRRICSDVSAPVNALAVGEYAKMTRAEFADYGVARISVGSALARVAQGAFLEAARRILSDGDFSDLLNAASGAEVDALLMGSQS